MDDLLNREASRLQDAVEAGTMNGYYSYLGFLADFARKVENQIAVTDKDETK